MQVHGIEVLPAGSEATCFVGLGWDVFCRHRIMTAIYSYDHVDKLYDHHQFHYQYFISIMIIVMIIGAGLLQTIAFEDREIDILAFCCFLRVGGF
jgi:hypothetical protein